MTHVGVALDHPDNAQVLARMSRIAVLLDRPDTIARLEALDAKHPSTAVRIAIDRLKAGIPDPPRPPSQSPAEVNKLELGTHPDLIDRLWALGRDLPEDCSWVCYRQPVLVHPRSGVVFGLGIGTLGYALRLAPAESAEARAAGFANSARYRTIGGEALLSLEEYGADWWFGRYDPREPGWLLAAYERFGRPAPPPIRQLGEQVVDSSRHKG